MENAYIFRILTLCAAALAVTAEPSIRLEVINTQLQPGDTLKFTCVAENLVGGTSFLRIQKTIEGTDAPVEPLILATNAIKSLNLKQLDRYTVTFEAGANSNQLRFVFTATDAQYADSGVYGCSIMGGSGVIVEDNKEITVINVVDFVIEMTVTRANGETATYTNLNDEVHEYELDEHESFHINIRTSQTYPAPTMVMQVGSQDIDDQFVKTVTPADYQDSTGLLTGVKYTMTAEGNIMVDHSYRNGFKVTGTAAGHEESVSFKVKFSGYPPVIDESCTHNIMAGNHQKNVNFECTITSDEPVDVFFYYFRDLDGAPPEKEIITPGDYSDYHYEASLYEDRENGEYDVALHMPLMYPEMFTEYTMFAANSKGNVTHNFTLEEDASLSPVDVGHASHLSITIATVLMFAITAILSQQL